MMQQELEYFFAALRFFTRLPVPAWVGHSSEQLNHAARYFSLVGIIVGATGATVTIIAALVLPLSIAILLGMVATLLVTGAFHEDGLADSIDGFGGGWAKLRILEIMKDSRVGSYGAIAIALLLLTKFTALQELTQQHGALMLAAVLVTAHALSRFASTTLLYALEYVREDELAKSKPLAKQLSTAELLCAAVFGGAPILLLAWFGFAIYSLITAIAFVTAITVYAARYFKKHLGGYTGDCLGATQQLTEVFFYLGLLCNFS